MGKWKGGCQDSYANEHYDLLHVIIKLNIIININQDY